MSDNSPSRPKSPADDLSKHSDDGAEAEANVKSSEIDSAGSASGDEKSSVTPVVKEQNEKQADNVPSVMTSTTSSNDVPIKSNISIDFDDKPPPPEKKKKDPNNPGAEKFPSILHKILSDEANSGIISWLPNGKAFIITNKKRFENETLPRYFRKQTRYTSFTRKLIRWNFTRQSSGPYMGAYHHKFFCKDKPSLCLLISCQGALSREKMKAAESLFGASLDSNRGLADDPRHHLQPLLAEGMLGGGRSLMPSSLSAATAAGAGLPHCYPSVGIDDPTAASSFDNYQLEARLMALSRASQQERADAALLRNSLANRTAAGVDPSAYLQDPMVLGGSNADLVQHQIIDAAKRALGRGGGLDGLPAAHHHRRPPPIAGLDGLNSQHMNNLNTAMDPRTELALSAAGRYLHPSSLQQQQQDHITALSNAGYLPPNSMNAPAPSAAALSQTQNGRIQDLSMLSNYLSPEERMMLQARAGAAKDQQRFY